MLSGGKYRVDVEERQKWVCYRECTADGLRGEISVAVLGLGIEDGLRGET